MTASPRARLGAVAFVATAALLIPAVAHGWGPTVDVPRSPNAGPSWRDVLQRAAQASSGTPFAARMVVVTLDERDGPHVTEVQLSRDDEGALQVGQYESWLIGRHGDAAFLHDAQDDKMLRLGPVEAVPFDLDAVERNYRVGIDRRADLDTGRAVVLTFERNGIVRERLFVDEATNLVVRRETFDLDGRAARVVALTELTITGEPLEMPSEPRQDWRHVTAVDPAAVPLLEDLGPDHPAELPGGFELLARYRVQDDNASQLLYSDGLYTLSIYEQHGRVDPDALDGAVGYKDADMAVYRWPGAEPQRIVWSGGGHTFTAVTDAPVDVLMAAVAALPHEAPSGLMHRVTRGFKRVGGWLWPF